jgi:hypothetical protein
LSIDLIDLIDRLLLLNPSERLGAKNINELGILKGFSCDNLEIISERNSGLFKLSTFSI